MSYFNSFKRIVGDFLFITGVPALASLFAPKFGLDWLQVFFVTLFFMWVLSIEARLKDLKPRRKK
jgi:hypothetical protein